jgi:regulator of ribonuclease activity A
VRVHEDNVLVEEALGDVEPGTVLVVDGGGSRRCALLGGRLAELAASRGLAAVVVYGCVRDTTELSWTDLGILALAPHPRKSRKNGEGERDVTVEFGGIRLAPGDYVYADPDGVVVTEASLV